MKIWRQKSCKVVQFFLFGFLFLQHFLVSVCLDEARDSYMKEIVVELQSDDSEQMESNAERIALWFKTATEKATASSPASS